MLTKKFIKKCKIVKCGKKKKVFLKLGEEKWAGSWLAQKHYNKLM